MCKSFESMGCMMDIKMNWPPRSPKKQAQGPIGVFLGGMGVCCMCKSFESGERAGSGRGQTAEMQYFCDFYKNSSVTIIQAIPGGLLCC